MIAVRLNTLLKASGFKSSSCLCLPLYPLTPTTGHAMTIPETSFLFLLPDLDLLRNTFCHSPQKLSHFLFILITTSLLPAIPFCPLCSLYPVHPIQTQVAHVTLSPFLNCYLPPQYLWAQQIPVSHACLCECSQLRAGPRSAFPFLIFPQCSL